MFLYRCTLRFTDLPGTSDRHRRCDLCATLVTNLDALSPKDRQLFFENAAVEGRTVCVSVTPSEMETKPCGGREILDGREEAAQSAARNPLPIPTMGTVQTPNHPVNRR